jgi:hypothetical protein
VAELKKIIFNALYAWIAAHNSLIFSSFSNFLNHCSSFFSNYEIFLYTSCVLVGLHPYVLFQ